MEDYRGFQRSAVFDLGLHIVLMSNRRYLVDCLETHK